jgi:nucleoside-diphosphate-sugar epimerase
LGDRRNLIPHSYNIVRDKMKILLTGAGGFVGHHAIPYLLKTTDWELVLTDSFNHLGTSSRLREAIKDLSNQDEKRIKVVSHDLSTPIDKITASEFGKIIHEDEDLSEYVKDRLKAARILAMLKYHEVNQKVT